MKIFKRGQKGFTLVELMVVMAIIAVLAAIVIPPVTGTKQVSTDSQVKQDATNVQTAVGKYNADSNLAEEVTTDTKTAVTADTIASPNNAVISNKWPEAFIQTVYAEEFPTVATLVPKVTIKDEDGNIVYQTGLSGKTLVDFLKAYNAINFTDKLTVSSGYLQAIPNGVDAMFVNQNPYNNYLWLLKKVEDGSGGTIRVVEVYSLTTVVKNTSTVELTYKRIY